MAKLKSITFENFRTFEKEVTIEIAPITILVGPNGSGKSSVLKLIELLKINLDKGSLNTLRVDFPGLELHTIDNIFNNNGTSETINISIIIEFDPTELEYYLFGKSIIFKLMYKRLFEDIGKLFLQKVELFDRSIKILELTAEKVSDAGVSVFFDSSLNFDIFLKKIIALFDEDFNRLFKYICINDYEFHHDDLGRPIFLEGTIIDPNSPAGFYFNKKNLSLTDKMLALLDVAESIKDANYKPNNSKSEYDIIENLISKLTKLSSDTLTHSSIHLSLIKPISTHSKIFGELFSFHEPHSFYCASRKLGFEIEKKFNNLFAKMLAIIGDFMKINSDLKQQRFYRYEEFIKHYSEEKVSVLQKDYYFSEEYTKLFDIQGQMIFKDIDGIGIQIKIIKNSAEIDLCDIGYGYSKLLPILYLLWIKRTEATWEQRDMHFILEEPESNLHPSLQSRLGDFFTSLIKDNIVSSITKENKTQIGLIIETHSEYLIRKLQYLTAKGELKTDDTVIYYFYHPDKVPEGEKQVYKINIDDRGRLTKNFGEGFFDVAGELEFLLYSNTN